MGLHPPKDNALGGGKSCPMTHYNLDFYMLIGTFLTLDAIFLYTKPSVKDLDYNSYHKSFFIQVYNIFQRKAKHINNVCVDISNN